MHPVARSIQKTIVPAILKHNPYGRKVGGCHFRRSARLPITTARRSEGIPDVRDREWSRLGRRPRDGFMHDAWASRDTDLTRAGGVAAGWRLCRGRQEVNDLNPLSQPGTHGRQPQPELPA